MLPLTANILPADKEAPIELATRWSFREAGETTVIASDRCRASNFRCIVIRQAKKWIM